MSLEALKPNRDLLILTLSFIGILLICAVMAGSLEVLIYGEIQDVDESSSADLLYLLAIGLATYAQASFAQWFLESE